MSKRWRSVLAVFIAGTLTPLSLAPFNFWPMAIIGPAIFAYYLQQQNTAKSFLLFACVFGLGYYSVGIHWIYISIHTFGGTPVALALLLLGLFIAFMALLFAIPFYGLIYIKSHLRLLVGFPLLWFLSEWLRTWVLTGFPWLLLGYAHTDTALSGWTPIGGVLLISLWSAICSSTIAGLFCSPVKAQYKAIGCFLMATGWLAGNLLEQQQWTQVSPQAIRVGIAQPNIPQDLRWTEPYQTIIPERLHRLTHQLQGNDWIIWPEGVIHNTYHHSAEFIEQSQRLAEKNQSHIISGVIYDEYHENSLRPTFFNSVIVIDHINQPYEHSSDRQNIYHKRRLVPFGEYVPLEHWLRGLISFFDLPFSVISSVKEKQHPLKVGDYFLGNAICYEIAYPTLVAEQAKNADVLLTVSNDAWFGDSIGPYQHLQIAQMRAKETGRYIIRSTNNGISAIIDPQGKVIQHSEQFAETTLAGTVYATTGTTPYLYWKNYPLLILFIVLLIASRSSQRKPPNYVNRSVNDTGHLH